MRGLSGLLAACSVLLSALPALAQVNQKLHFTYLWHLEQPVYWPDRQASGVDRYERAYESLLRKNAGAAHPEDDLNGIFGLADRQAAYQSGIRNSLNTFRSINPEAGVQLTYSGGLIENITSLGNAGALGYGSGWFSGNREARNWLTTSGFATPKLDIVLFPFHHALMPLLEESTMRKEIQLYKAIYPDAWGSSPPISQGFFPSEMAFSTRMIPVLASEGIQWSVVSAEKISRACADFPVVFGSGGINTDPPNKADQINPAQGISAYFRQTISRGCAPAEAFPFALTPRRAQYIDPSTGVASSIIVVPSSQSLSWTDGYSPQGIGDFDTLNTRNNPARPMLVLMAHDGDNAWGGGYSYYNEATPNRVGQANAAGYAPSTVQRYLNDHPVPADDVVHVEDGAWVNADGDFGAPQFINWNWPLLNSAGQIDVENGWHIDARNWAVITAMQNRLDTAEKLWLNQSASNTVNIRKILYPDATSNAVERGWHYFLAGLNSGFMYYGTPLDMEVKPTIACNNTARLIDPYISSVLTPTPSADVTAPTIWYPQRHPWNPGSTNFGPQYGYRQQINNGDFYVWSFVYDLSGVPAGGVTLKYRLDVDGQNPLSSVQNETYAGGAEVGVWQTIVMTKRVFPAGNVYNDPSINFYVMPTAIADQYWGKINGVRNALVDYYIEATDARGNIKRSGIQHVWVGDGAGSTGGGNTGGGAVVTLAPATPTAGQQVTVSYNPAGRGLAGAASVKIHWGINGWTGVPSPDPAMTWNATQSVWQITLSIPSTASSLQCVFNNGAGTWDNNGGQDWSFTVTGGVQPFVMDGTVDSGAVPIASSAAGTLYAAVRGNQLYVAGPAPGSGRDSFLFVAQSPPGPGVLQTAQWGKAGQVAKWDSFIGAENDNAFIGWFDVAAGVTKAQARGAVIEGTIDMAQRWGAIPSSVSIAFAQWNNPDGGALVATRQLPASLNDDANLNANEYVTIDVCALTAAGCPTACNPADITGPGGPPAPPDGQLSVEDFITFLAEFTDGGGCPGVAACNRADLTGAGGLPAPPDGDLSVEDFITFLNEFSAGCP